MLSDEERKIETLKKYINSQEQKTNDYYKIDEEFYKDEIEQLEFSIKLLRYILNLIEKQSEEIEELHKEINQRIKLKLENERCVDEYFIHKDKIKEILGIEEETDTEKILSLLQTIVDENNRLEDIEDRKVQIEYNNVFNKGVKSVEDKIKAKIEEVDYKMIAHQDVREAVKQTLQSLLRKE